jgi:hypothetical protein
MSHSARSQRHGSEATSAMGSFESYLDTDMAIQIEHREEVLTEIRRLRGLATMEYPEYRPFLVRSMALHRCCGFQAVCPGLDSEFISLTSAQAFIRSLRKALPYFHVHPSFPEPN